MSNWIFKDGRASLIAMFFFYWKVPLLPIPGRTNILSIPTVEFARAWQGFGNIFFIKDLELQCKKYLEHIVIWKKYVWIIHQPEIS